jgi:hypothetical protein
MPIAELTATLMVSNQQEDPMGPVSDQVSQDLEALVALVVWFHD